jgi:hypothetical protein
MSNVLLANITWNPTGWRNTYINPKAGHLFAKKNAGLESHNFKFDKKYIDTESHIHGFVQWVGNPLRFEKSGVIIFYTTNTDIRSGQIVGIYGKAELIPDKIPFTVKGFSNNNYAVNIKGEKAFSMLFPIPLSANNYKTKTSERLVGQNGFSYKDTHFLEKILSDELKALSNSGILENEFQKLAAIYESYIGKCYTIPYLCSDELEQDQIVKIINTTKSRQEIIDELTSLSEFDSQEIIINHKSYKRDNKTIALLKILRGFKCQICNQSILKKNGLYIEAAHLIPKNKKGTETPDNIILLCPNHHKEFDWGDTIIDFKNKDIVKFTMNKKEYIINLELK